MIKFPFSLEDTESLFIFTTAIVPGKGNAFPAISGGIPRPTGDGILLETGAPNFVVQESSTGNNDFIIQES